SLCSLALVFCVVVFIAHSSTHIFFFFFYSYAHPRHLHSFPTRRSSDLTGPQYRPSPAASRPAESSKETGRMPDVRWLDRQSPSIDRKSTRLNSSHQIISYAVFCLKKKKKNDKTNKPQNIKYNKNTL